MKPPQGVPPSKRGGKQHDKLRTEKGPTTKTKN
jgi:hypothetical protein